MVEITKGKLVITIDNICTSDYLRIVETLIWTLGYFAEQQEILTHIHTLAWLAEAMLPSEEQLKTKLE